ncbi:MAG: S1/P1 nuclease [Rhodocyclaceae bacterium]
MARAVFILLALASTSVWTTDASAWGRKGHAAVAALAQAHLTPAAQAQVEALMRDDLDRDGKPSGRKTLAQIASWPDEIRDIAPKGEYAGWHTRGNPVCSDSLATCKDGHCVDENIIHYAALLHDKQQPARVRNEALKWVVHLVGDLHQPLHSGVGLDKGQATVELEDLKAKPGTTLHEAWDTQLAELALSRGPLQWHAYSATPLAADAPTQWMLETRQVALRAVYQPLEGFACDTKLKSPVRLDHAYEEQAVPVIREQMERAGARLAQLLNQSLD